MRRDDGSDIDIALNEAHLTLRDGTPVLIRQLVAEDAVSALVNLGYRRPEAQPAIARVIERLGDTAPLDAVIREALKELGQRVGG